MLVAARKTPFDSNHQNTRGATTHAASQAVVFASSRYDVRHTMPLKGTLLQPMFRFNYNS